MNFEKTRLLSADIMKLLKQIYSDQSASNLEKDLLKEKLRAMYEAIDEEPESASPHRNTASFENGNAFTSRRLEPESKETEDTEEPAVENSESSRQEPANHSFSFLDEAVEEAKDDHDENEPANSNQDTPVYEAAPYDSPQGMNDEEESEQTEEPYVRPSIREEPVSTYEPEAPPSEQTPQSELPNYSRGTQDSKAEDMDESETIIQEDELVEIEELFYFQEARELSDRLSLSPIADLTKALGINDRLLTVNELFGGDYAFFDESFRKLNSMNSFEEAKSYLKDNVVQDQDWLNPVKKERAKRFIKFIKRRYIN